MSTSSSSSPGARFRAAVETERPLQIVGTINAFTAMLAEQAGFRAIYLSGAGVANASLGLPDLGMTTLTEVLEDVRRIARATALPLLVDVDTGFGGGFMVARTTREIIAAGAAAMHIEDQVQAKRCGHRPGKALVSADEMIERVKAAVDARTDKSFVVMARTDAYSIEGLNAAVERACRYADAGADMIFSEALSTLDEYRAFTRAVKVPVLANITEFGKTPLFTIQELASADVAMALYPLSAFRAMSDAAVDVFQTIRRDGTQKAVVSQMQTRDELYRILRYHEFERIADEHLKKR